jgi:hypothetical protein
MILSGILHTSLGGFTVIRGVAPLGELARCSRFDAAYQRNLIETHRSEIEQFLADRQFLFFPEVVLSVSWPRRTEPKTRALRARCDSTTCRVAARFEAKASEGFMYAFPTTKSGFTQR